MSLYAMIFNVPQFIDVEDKIAGPLTAKQLLWMVGMGASILVAKYLLGNGVATYVASVPIVIVFCLLAFYRPNGQPLIVFVMHGAFFLVRPKIMNWHRPIDAAHAWGFPSVSKRPTSVRPAAKTARSVSGEDIRRIAEMVDRKP